MNDLARRIFDFSKDPQLISFATTSTEGQPRVRYVVGKVDEKLDLRFATHLATPKVEAIRHNPKVSATLGSNGLATPEWLQVEGWAEISTSSEERHSFWLDGLKEHFSGPDDPNLCIVIVHPTRIEFISSRNKTFEVWTPEA